MTIRPRRGGYQVIVYAGSTRSPAATGEPAPAQSAKLLDVYLAWRETSGKALSPAPQRLPNGCCADDWRMPG